MLANWVRSFAASVFHKTNIILLMIVSLVGCSSQQAAYQKHNLLCEIDESPAQFEGKSVAVEVAIKSNSPHGYMFEGPGCVDHISIVLDRIAGIDSMKPLYKAEREASKTFGKPDQKIPVADFQGDVIVKPNGEWFILASKLNSVRLELQSEYLKPDARHPISDTQ